MNPPEDIKYCRCCKALRAAANKTPRIMTPVTVKGREEPLYMCDRCDGDALRNAKNLEASHYDAESGQ